MRRGAAIRHCEYVSSSGKTCPRELTYRGLGRPPKWCDEHRVVVRRNTVRLAVRSTRQRHSLFESVAGRVSRRIDETPESLVGCFRQLGPGPVLERILGAGRHGPVAFIDSLIHRAPVRRALRHQKPDTVAPLLLRVRIIVRVARPLWPAMTNWEIRHAVNRYLWGLVKEEKQEEKKVAATRRIIQSLSNAIVGLPADLRALVVWTRSMEALLTRLIERGTHPTVFIPVLFKRPYIHQVAVSDTTLYSRFVSEGISTLLRAARPGRAPSDAATQRRVRHIARCLEAERRRLNQVRQAPGVRSTPPSDYRGQHTESAENGKPAHGANSRSKRKALRVAQ
jgi:hypothetical protein